MKTLQISVILIVCVFVIISGSNEAFAQTQYNFKVWPTDPWNEPGFWENIQGKICPTPVPDQNTHASTKTYFGLPPWAATQAHTPQIVQESSTLPSCDKVTDISTVRPNYTGIYPVYAISQWTQDGIVHTVQSNNMQFFSQESCPIAYAVQTDGTKYYAGQTVLITVRNAFNDCHYLPHDVLLKITDVTDNSTSAPVYQNESAITNQTEFSFTLPKFPPQDNPRIYHVEILYNYTATKTVMQDGRLVYSYNYVNNPPPDVQNTRLTQVVRMTLPPDALYSYVKYGDGIQFLGYQLSPYDNILGKSAISGIQVNISITGPMGNIVYNRTETTDNNGQFPEITFPITKDLKRGLYETHYSSTKEGGVVFMEGTNNTAGNYFVVGNETKFTTTWGGKPYQFSYYGVSTDASKAVFNQTTKSITFDIQKINGPFSKADHIPTYGPMHSFTDYSMIKIEKPLLTGPFTSVFNDKIITSYTTLPNGSENGPELIGPIDDSGNLVFTGTYAVPEFPFSIPVLLVATLLTIMLYGIKFKKLMSAIS